MDTWEYLIYYPIENEIRFSSEEKREEHDMIIPSQDREIMQLSLFGKNGWEVMVVSSRKYILKRKSEPKREYPGPIGDTL